MTRQSVSITDKNREWLKNQISKDIFNSESEVINHLIRQARSQEEYRDFVRMKIEKGEQSGFAKKQTREELLAEIKSQISK